MQLNKKLAICWIGLLAICLLVIPIINHYYKVPFGDSSIVAENKKLNRTERRLSGFFNRNYNIDYIERLINKFLYNHDIRIKNSKVVIGKDGFIFLNNSSSNYLIKKHRDLAFANRYSLNNNIKGIVELEEYLKQQSIQFLFVLAPNKISIYPDKLPIWMTLTGSNQTSNYTLEQLNKSGVDTIDLRPTLLKYTTPSVTNDRLLYYMTDTHWNRFGAYLGYKATVDKLDKDLNLSIKEVSCIVANVPTKLEAGDLARQLRINDIVKEDIDYYQGFEGNSDVIKIAEIDGNDFSTLVEQQQKNPYVLVRKNVIHVHNPKALNNKKVLYVRDSFGSANSQLYAKTFSDLYHVSYENMTKDNFMRLVKKVRPDIVIFQVVERSFDTPFGVVDSQ